MKLAKHTFLAALSATALIMTGCDRNANYPTGSNGMPEPTAMPSVMPTAMPSDLPTSEPTVQPTAAPTAMPTGMPSTSPTVEPSASPTASPSASSSPSPSPSATVSPSATPSPSASPTGPRTVFALTNNNQLLRFNSDAPATISSTIGITGLMGTGETLMGIDFRPVNGALFGISNQNKIYTINTTTGAVTQVGSAIIDPIVSGTQIGFDFNPTVDRIRLHSNLRQDLRLNPENGTVAAVDTTLAYATGDVNFGTAASIVGSAYTNSVAGATSTELYAIDSEKDVLVRLNNPNDGQLTTVGPLNVATSGDVGFDIATNGVAYATLTSGTGSTFYTINLTNGGSNLVGAIGAGNQVVIGLAVQ